jgi:Mn2+/Fe2+ NRAMP family transporter
VAVRFVVLLLVPVAVVSYVAGRLLVVLCRDRAPRIAAIAEAWSPWLPVLVVLVALAFVHPAIAVVGGAGLAIFLTSSRAIGSPFRPRR